MIELTESQRRELSQPEPLAIDPLTKETYILVRQAAYLKMKSLLATDEYDPEEVMAEMNEVMAEDNAGNPLLESYQHYGKKA